MTDFVEDVNAGPARRFRNPQAGGCDRTPARAIRPAISSRRQELTTRLAVGGKAEARLAPRPDAESSTPLTYNHIIEQALA